MKFDFSYSCQKMRWTLETILSKGSELHGDVYEFISSEPFRGLMTRITLKHTECDTIFQVVAGNYIHCRNGCNRKECVLKKKAATNFKRYGVAHVFQSTTMKEKTKATNLDRHGVPHISQAKTVKAKRKATTLARYGVENVAQSKPIQDKIKATNLDRFGVEHALDSKIVREKVNSTVFERYGVTSVLQLEAVKVKMKATIVERYGVSHHMHCPEIFKKVQSTAFKRNGKSFTFPSGTVHLCQGYEPVYFKFQTATPPPPFSFPVYTESDFNFEPPFIKYTHNDKQRKYYPDAFIPKDSKLIEVKSTRTFGNTENCRDNFRTNVAKFRAASREYNLEIWIMTAKDIVAIVRYDKGCEHPVWCDRAGEREWDETGVLVASLEK